MGLMDSLKKATGIGLSHSEHFDRAYEKAVLLGEANYVKAAELFENAAKKAAEAGDSALEAHARANSALYGYITSGNEQYLVALRENLKNVPQIERIGSKSETVDSAPLLGEVEARLTESAMTRVPATDNVALAKAHIACSEAFKKIFNEPLVTYKYQHVDGHRETAQSRFFYHQGLASWSQAVSDVATSPETAAEHMSRALNAFRQCGDTKWAEQADAWRSNCRQKRTCWVCHREFQGATIHFRTFPANVSPYAAAVVQSLGQDASSIDVAARALVLCDPCGSAVEGVADAFATRRTQELRREVQTVLAQHQSAIAELSNRVQALERTAHRH